jgi:hypothetical protein
VAGFIITGGQDNVQAVAGQMLAFFAELGCQFPQFPYIAHSRGWSAEDMEHNQRRGAATRRRCMKARQALAARCAVQMARMMIEAAEGKPAPSSRGGRKGGARAGARSTL